MAKQSTARAGEQRTREVALVPAVTLESADKLPARQGKQRHVILERKMTRSVALAISNPALLILLAPPAAPTVSLSGNRADSAVGKANAGIGRPRPIRSAKVCKFTGVTVTPLQRGASRSRDAEGSFSLYAGIVCLSSVSSA